MSPSKPIVAIPVKAFGIAKQRLSPELDPNVRSHLGKAVARRTARMVHLGGGDPIIVCADRVVSVWASEADLTWIDQRNAQDLEGAAYSALGHATSAGRPWIFLHADLPLLEPDDIAALMEGLKRGPVIAPSHDGGTSAIGGAQDITFRYGPGSFHHHLSQLPDATVVTRPGLAHDLDTIDDYRLIERIIAVTRPSSTPWAKTTHLRVAL